MPRFGLLGKSLKHSFSQGYFAQKFADLQLAGCSYENFELQSVLQLPALLAANPDLAGLNVTIPYKQEVIPLLHHQSADVKAIGACNCIRIKNGELTGYNTDWKGFLLSLQPHLQAHHQKALLLGSGGASKAVQFALGELGISWQIVSTSGRGALSYAQVSAEVLSEYQLIVNTTPLGMFPDANTAPPIAYEALGMQHLLYDLVYNPAETLFLKKGKERGAQVLNGYEMLVLQAEESWRLWNQD